MRATCASSLSAESSSCRARKLASKKASGGLCRKGFLRADLPGRRGDAMTMRRPNVQAQYKSHKIIITAFLFGIVQCWSQHSPAMKTHRSRRTFSRPSSGHKLPASSVTFGGRGRVETMWRTPAHYHIKCVYKERTLVDILITLARVPACQNFGKGNRAENVEQTGQWIIV